jgi:hypothetical protein
MQSQLRRRRFRKASGANRHRPTMSEMAIFQQLAQPAIESGKRLYGQLDLPMAKKTPMNPQYARTRIWVRTQIVPAILLLLRGQKTPMPIPMARMPANRHTPARSGLKRGGDRPCKEEQRKPGRREKRFRLLSAIVLLDFRSLAAYASSAASSVNLVACISL